MPRAPSGSCSRSCARSRRRAGERRLILGQHFAVEPPELGNALLVRECVEPRERRPRLDDAP